MLCQVWGPDAKGVTWLRKLALVGVSASFPPVHRVLGPQGAGQHRLGVCRALQGGAGLINASSSACRVPPFSGRLGFPPSPGWGATAPSSLCVSLVLNGRGLQRVQQAVECKPGWGRWRWVESRDGWP